MIDKDEYPQTRRSRNAASTSRRPVERARSARDDRHLRDRLVGACMLAGLAFKRRWQIRRRAEASRPSPPNIVFQLGRPGRVEKFANYGRSNRATCRSRRTSRTSRRRHACGRRREHDRRGPILGVTYNVCTTGEGPCCCTRRSRGRTGLDVPMHVDAASGGFIASFLDRDLEWTSACRACTRSARRAQVRPRVPGLGGLVAKREYMPEELIFTSRTSAGHAALALTSHDRRAGVLQYYNLTSVST